MIYILENDELKNYKAKAEFYVRQHQDNIVIAKLKTNQPLTEMDIESLEQILWKEVGSKDDYEKEYDYQVQWMRLDDIIKKNEAVFDVEHIPWVERELMVMKELKKM